jgi:hypothetical protein
MRTYARTRLDTGEGVQRHEVLAAIAELAGLFLIFIVAFTGREHFGDLVRQLLIALTFVVGGLGVGAGLAILRRAVLISQGRVARLALGGAMVFMGAYSIIHVAR